MKRFISNLKNILPLSALASLALLPACSDDLFPDGEKRPGADNGVVVYVPKVAPDAEVAPSSRTRGELNDFKKEEGVIKSLYLFAYPKNGGASKVLELTNSSDVETITANVPEGYTGYKLDLTPGDYRFYVAANVNFTNASSMTETALKNFAVSAPGSAKEGLPMSCANNQLQVCYNGETDYKSVTDESGVNVAASASVKVKADLRFAVAKVRVTLLNDARQNLKLNSSEITNLADVAPLMSGGTVNATLSGSDFVKKGYYELPEMKENLLQVTVDGMTPKDNAEGLWAWQGTAYVAERLFAANADDKSAVNLSFSDGTTKILPLGTAGEGLKRSYFYDYVGKSNGEFKMQLQPWDPVAIAGAIHGPYFLHVDKTEIDQVKAGEEYAIWYESNAPVQVEPHDVYDFTIENDNIKFTVSPRVQNEQFEAVQKGDKWKTFTVKAGTIIKTINVKTIDLSEFLMVDTDNVSIDVRERIESGTYSGSIVLPVRTNLKSFTVTKVGEWPTDANLLNVCDAEGNPLTTTTVTPDAGGVTNLQLSFSGLNDGVSFWQNSGQVQLLIKGTDSTGKTIEHTVTINTLANVDDYTIHLYAPTWSNPHIYVYQTLELPSDHSKHPNAPVGVNKDQAALEYSFTGAVAFRGWNVAAADGKNYNDPTCSTEKQGNFQVFNDGDSKDNWEPGKGNWENHYYDMDFCEEYRNSAEMTCKTCKDKVRIWPGIRMKDNSSSEGNGWWIFKLSGIAKPGKALIMFTDVKLENDHSSWNNRYPDANQPGIPLFDYPSKEGWFDVTSDNKQFVGTKPVIQAPEVRSYRIYWPYNSSDWTGLNVWSGSYVWGNEIYNSWPSTMTLAGTKGKYGKYNDNYAYLEFSCVKLSGTANYQRMWGDNKYDNDKMPQFNLPTSTDTDGYYSYTITSNGSGHSGKPTDDDIPLTKFPAGDYAITCSSGQFSIWVWTDKENVSQLKGEDWNNSMFVVKSGFPYTFTLNQQAETLTFKKNKGNTEHKKKISDFTYNSATGRYEYDATSDSN